MFRVAAVVLLLVSGFASSMPPVPTGEIYANLEKCLNDSTDSKACFIGAKKQSYELANSHGISKQRQKQLWESSVNNYLNLSDSDPHKKDYESSQFFSSYVWLEVYNK